ncbi:MAG TPA: BON domain-containing protein [Pirellulales bacterium]|nr:BON domain-containing protein [Pirellulales bacterium]
MQTAAAIRRAITKDDSLSTNAHNIKIIARDGAVTLRGPVDSEDEKTTIVNDAKRIARGSRIVDELEVGRTQLK